MSEIYTAITNGEFITNQPVEAKALRTTASEGMIRSVVCQNILGTSHENPFLFTPDMNEAQRIWAEWCGYTLIAQQFDGGYISNKMRQGPVVADMLGYGIDPDYAQTFLRDPYFANRMKDNNWAEVIGGESFGSFHYDYEKYLRGEEERTFIAGPRLIAITDPATSEDLNKMVHYVTGQKAAPDGFVFETYPVTTQSLWTDGPETIRRIRMLGAVEYTGTKLYVHSKVDKLLSFAESLDVTNHERVLAFYDRVVQDIFGINDGLRVVARMPKVLQTYFIKIGFESALGNKDNKAERHPWQNTLSQIGKHTITPQVSVYSFPKAPEFKLVKD